MSKSSVILLLWLLLSHFFLEPEHNGRSLEGSLISEAGCVGGGRVLDEIENVFQVSSFAPCDSVMVEQTIICILFTSQRQWITEYLSPLHNGATIMASEANYSLGREVQQLLANFSANGTISGSLRRRNCTSKGCGGGSPASTEFTSDFHRKPKKINHRKPKRAKSWYRYYANSCARRHLLLQGGDICENPGPTLKIDKPKCC